METGTIKLWLSPFVAAAFAATGLSGMLMLLHVRSFAIHAVHEWMGLLFVLAGVLHAALNGGPLAAYLRRGAGRASLCIGLLLIVLLCLLGSLHTPGPHGSPARRENASEPGV